MNLRDLHYFVVLAQTHHFGEAAKRCHVTQPTLSMQIKKLEEELGSPLFERNNKQVMLTELGRTLVARVQTILSEVAQIKEIARAAADPFAGELRLGVIPTLAPYLLPRVMPGIQAAFPNLQIWLVEERTQKLVEKLNTGELDAALMATPVQASLKSQILFNEPFYYASAPRFLAKNKTIDLKELATQPLLLLEEGHCLRDQAMAICQNAKVETQVDFSATSMETLRLMVEAGLGVTLLPALAVQGIANDKLRILPFTDPVPFRSVALFWRPSSAKVHCLTALAQKISQIIQPILAP